MPSNEDQLYRPLFQHSSVLILLRLRSVIFNVKWRRLNYMFTIIQCISKIYEYFLMNAHCQKRNISHRLQKSKFHCLVYKILYQILSVVCTDRQVPLAAEFFLSKKATNICGKSSWTIKKVTLIQRNHSFLLSFT